MDWVVATSKQERAGRVARAAAGWLVCAAFVFGCEKEQAPAPPVAKTPAPVRAAQPPPPPPPPPEVEDAAPESQPAPPPKKKRAAAKPTTPVGCQGECTGQAGASLLSRLRRTAGLARSCYNRALSNNSALQGKMTVQVKVGSGGEACGVSITSDTLGDDSVARCVRSKFSGGRLPAPSGGCVEVAVPISFVAN